MLLGAMFSLLAIILDGCDGEGARLKLQGSDLGWSSQTICDYPYYLFIFAGVTIGLTRNSGPSRIWFGAACFLLGPDSELSHLLPSASVDKRTS